MSTGHRIYDAYLAAQDGEAYARNALANLARAAAVAAGGEYVPAGEPATLGATLGRGAVHPNTLNAAREIKRAMIRAACDVAGSRFVTFTFTKADGSARHLTTCNRATVGLAGDAAEPARKRAVKTRATNNPHLLNRYDVRAKGWRSVNLDSVTVLRLEGVTLIFDDLS